MANDGCAIAVLGYCCVGMMELVTRLDAQALWVARVPAYTIAMGRRGAMDSRNVFDEGADAH
jgi:hypothetical protein